MGRFASMIAVFSLILSVILPITAQAATTAKTATTGKTTGRVRIAMNLYDPKRHYGDEKTDIENPTTRCLTAAAKKARIRDLANYEADGKKAELDEDTTGPLADAYKKYKTAMEYAWDAMNEPYCGFGAFGSSAALKSYEKTVSRARANFQDAVKKLGS